MQLPIGKTIICLLLTKGLVLISDCAKILGVFDTNSMSHFQMLEALMKTLTSRGHEVVVLSHFPQKTPVPNYTDIDVSGSIPNVMDNMTIDRMKHFTAVGGMFTLWTYYRENCHKTMMHPNARKLLESTQLFDLVITEIFACECSLGFVHKFSSLLISVDTSVGFPWTNERVGNPDNPAYIANYYLTYTNKMTFCQRMTNALYYIFLKVSYYVSNIVPTSALLQDIFGDDFLTIDKISMNTSLILVNSHFSMTEPRPTVPNYVEVGGLHIKAPNDLPQDIRRFMDESEHGVVYLSLGTLLQVQSLPPEKLSALTRVFSALPERVIMKYTGSSLLGKLENVMTGKWLPQQDILCHPKIKAFISHGGLMSMQEAVHAAVPVIGIPLFADQTLNIIRLASEGMAVHLPYDDLTEASLLQAVRTVTSDSKYKKNAIRMSSLFKDRPMTAMETAVYWVEYVIRHGGAPHLRSAATDMPLYQYLLLDVICVLLLAALIAAYIPYRIAKAVLWTLTGHNRTKLHHKIKRQ